MDRRETATTADPAEIARFEAEAEAWWDETGSFKPLHALNPPRLAFLRQRLAPHFGRDLDADRPFEGLTLLDIGCGGGLFAEPLARLGFAVTAIDAGERTIAIARAHAEKTGLAIDYRTATPEAVDGSFDVVTAMEVLEHVADVDAFVEAAARRLRPGGAFLGATLNRTPQSFALAIVGAERILKWLPAGTHQWKSFIRPSELATRLRAARIAPAAFAGIRYDIFRDRWVETRSLDVNYMVQGVKEG